MPVTPGKVDDIRAMPARRSFPPSTQASGRQIATGSTFAPRKCRAGMSTFADSTGLSTLPSANADRARAAPGGGIRGIPAESSPLSLTLSPLGRGDFEGLRSSSPLPLAGGVGGGHGTEKGRRHLLRRPHFPTVGDMVRFASRVKRKISFQSILFLQHLIHGHFFSLSIFPPPLTLTGSAFRCRCRLRGLPAACRGTGRGAGR